MQKVWLRKSLSMGHLKRISIKHFLGFNISSDPLMVLPVQMYWTAPTQDFVILAIATKGNFEFTNIENEFTFGRESALK